MMISPEAEFSFFGGHRVVSNQTFIVYMKSTLIIFRKGLCGFFRFPRRKVCGAICRKFYGKGEGVQYREWVSDG